VISEVVLPAERLAAHVARVRTLIRVSPDVYEQVVGLAELSVAIRANVPFFGLAARRGCRDRSHLFLDIPGQSHSPGVALYLAASERARMPPESRPDRIHVQRRKVAIQQTAGATESGGGELHRISGGHHGGGIRL
jgi:hypothetical protein